MERRIREIRADYALTKIPTRAFAANALYLEVIRLAYNLVTAFQRTCLPEEWESLTLSKTAYSDEDNQCSGLIVISVPGWCDQSSERSDAGFRIL
jgi:hypothetical protein